MLATMSGEPEPNVSFRSTLVASLILTAIVAIATALASRQVPVDGLIPVHWNARGEADGFGPRWALWATPAMMLGLTALFWVLPRIEPRRDNLLRSSVAYKATWLGMLLLLAAIQVGMILAAIGRQAPMLAIICVGIGLFFLTIGLFLGGIHSNHVFGVRTPWTLASELSWRKTHRVSGRLFVGYGLVMAVSPFLPFGRHFILWGTLAFVVVILAVAGIYSYLVWKSDPDRRPLRLKPSKPSNGVPS